ncbi:PIN domain-containing protein [Acetobacter sp. TBRC 12305]|uniref:PIN domain-containing protein n=1 Tax=Acetobacter garciniae TaxID=2817435 RepID=A0A939KNW2_9PROT|nr:PIN domain-containing protein [Acetobacter garciniae]MBO1326813.1 PIN domain-containing protein [Acetobacter garciniae]MBX0345929.1 PIN domain-containing protein [Acetobacter garciniae]
MSTIIATLDACVLYRGMLTDLLLWIADTGIFVPVWSDDIENEWSRNLIPRIGEAAVNKRRTEMANAYPSANFQAPSTLVTQIQTQCQTAGQKKDAHVIGTAVTAKADFIVTLNIKDFYTQVVASHGLKKIKPDAFLLHLLSTDPARTLAGVKAHRTSLRRTSPDATTYIAMLDGPKVEASRFAKALLPSLGSI